MKLFSEEKNFIQRVIAMISKYQKFKSVTIRRDLLKNAPYNPRVISDANKKKLKKNIKERGFFGGIVVNENTMNVVSGHKRLEILDSLERRKDYEITVEMVNLTEKEEKEQNIFFNNQLAQGEYDVDLLKSMFDDGIDIEMTGFNTKDLAVLDITLNEFQNETEINNDYKKTSGYIDKMKEAKKNHLERKIKENDSNFFIAIIFKDAEAKREFTKKYNISEFEQYIKAEDFFKLFDIAHPKK